LEHLHPGLGIQPGAYALVGMAALFGAAAHAPICSVIIVTEVTRGYGLLVPSVWVCSLAFLLVGDRSLYDKQVLHIEDSPAHQLEMRWNILNDLSCKDWMSPEVATIHESATFEEIYDGILSHRAFDKFPVVDSRGNAVGILSLKKVRTFFRDSEMRSMAIAADAMDPLEKLVTRDTSLAEAYQILMERDWSLLCVAEAPGSTRLSGVLTRRDILLAYNREMARRSQTWEEF
jgi:CIC family chloride channel protein